VEREAVGSGDLEGVRDELPEAGDGVGVDRIVSIDSIAVLHLFRTAIPRAPRKQTTFACSFLGDELYTQVDTSFSGGGGCQSSPRSLGRASPNPPHLDSGVAPGPDSFGCGRPFGLPSPFCFFFAHPMTPNKAVLNSFASMW